ncbi:UNVERIFIED_CONTAM: hypothetical protein Sangu_2931400 [Sesamum angustifolium]|uniref:GAG-pre-integrase domain-containing protein n=1 Tax=Sesamum angustifolium TaxID=2727405 RepID=A0AAW2IM39_9LAMI
MTEVQIRNSLTVILDNQFNETNYTDWLRNLRIVLDYENQGYIMDKPLPQTLPVGSSFEELRRPKDGKLTTAKSEASYWLLYLTTCRNRETSTSKVKGKRVGRYKRKKDKAKAKTVIVAKDAKSAPVAPVGMGKGKGRWVLTSSRVQTISATIAVRKGIGRSDWIMTAQNKYKLDNFENAQFWHARLGHISQDRMKRLVDSKSLEIDNLDNLPVYESCLKGNMTRKPFIGQSTLANGLLDLIYIDVCGLLNTQTRGGFSYFITFTNDHSRYDYFYLMWYKYEAFMRVRLEVENQIARNIKILQSDRGGDI